MWACGEQFAVLQWPFDALAQPLLGFQQPADVAPGDVGHFNEHLANRGRLDFA